MSTATKEHPEPKAVAAREAAEQGPLDAMEAVVRAHRGRLEAIVGEIAETDAAEQEASRAIGMAVAESGDAAPKELQAARSELRQHLQDLTAAKSECERLLAGAQRGLEDARRAEATRRYRKAREAEQEAAEDAQKALGILAAKLEVLRVAGRESYALGRDCGAETAATYRRRLAVRDLAVRTALPLPDLAVPNAQRVHDLPGRLLEVLPPIPLEAANAEE